MFCPPRGAKKGYQLMDYFPYLEYVEYFQLNIQLEKCYRSASEQNSPENFTFKRLDNSVQLFNLKCIENVMYSRSLRMY